MPGGSTLVIPHCRRVLLDAVQQTDTFGSVTLIATLIRFVRMSLACENKSDRRKFMRAANEKLITNELGPILRAPLIAIRALHDCTLRNTYPRVTIMLLPIIKNVVTVKFNPLLQFVEFTMSVRHSFIQPITSSVQKSYMV